MSDLDDYCALLTRTGVVFEREVAGGHESVFIREDAGPKNDGYNMFYVTLDFTSSGELIRIGAWE